MNRKEIIFSIYEESKHLEKIQSNNSAIDQKQVAKNFTRRVNTAFKSNNTKLITDFEFSYRCDAKTTPQFQRMANLLQSLHFLMQRTYGAKQ